MSADLRAVVLEALSAFGCPVAHAELAVYLQVFHGTALAPADMAALGREDRRAYQQGERRAVWICPALLGWSGFPADETLLTRSDWLLDQRIVTLVSQPVRQLWLTRQFCWFVALASEKGLTGVELLVEQAARRAEILLPPAMLHARLRPEQGDESGEQLDLEDLDPSVRFMIWGEIADDAHSALASVDADDRAEFAVGARTLGRDEQLFGGTTEP